MEKVTSQYRIPLSEITITFARSGGPGGQNVNKTSTKAIIRWQVGNSAVFTPEEKDRIRMKLRSYLTQNDEVVIHADEERSQLQNKEQGIERFQELIKKALVVPKKRRPTKPTLAAKKERLETKKHTSYRKRARRAAGFDKRVLVQ